jgi:hypothetical protein
MKVEDLLSDATGGELGTGQDEEDLREQIRKDHRRQARMGPIRWPEAPVNAPWRSAA